MIFEVTAILLIVLVVLLFFGLEDEKNLPPGPWKIPYLGNSPVKNLKQCQELRKKYGDIFRTKIGAVSVVYICNYHVAKEALSKTEFANRPDWQMFQLLKEERRDGAASGITLNNGKHWHHNRRFLLRHLRDLGMGKATIEDIILREVESLIEDFKRLTDEPSALPMSINVSVLNVVWQLIASERYDFSDKAVMAFMNSFEEISDSLVAFGLKEFFPIVNYIPTRLYNKLVGMEKLESSVNKLVDLVQPVIDKHIEKLDPDNPKDLMDDYLTEMLEKKSEDYSHFSYSDLIKNTFDLFVAGNDTTGNMTRFVLLYMAKYQDIQKKIQAEIDDIVPFDRIPSLEHRERLAYLDATINEVQRHCSLIPFGVFRSAATDTTLQGFRIPKGTIIQSLAGITHMDRAYWKNPETFDPTRFLDENNKFIQNKEGFQPFGLGKRQCIGESFARMDLYLFVAALLQKFSFGPPDGGDIDIEPIVRTQVHEPNKKQKLSIKLRKNKY